jgi:hypothetical protein
MHAHIPGLLLFKIMEDQCLLCCSCVISKRGAFFANHTWPNVSSVKTGTQSCSNPVSPANFKTCDCLTKFCNLVSSFASFSLPPPFPDRVPQIHGGSCHSGFICIHKIWKLNHCVWNEVQVLHSILPLIIHTVYIVCENWQYTVTVVNNWFWHQYHCTT